MDTTKYIKYKHTCWLVIKTKTIQLPLFNNRTQNKLCTKYSKPHSHIIPTCLQTYARFTLAAPKNTTIDPRAAVYPRPRTQLLGITFKAPRNKNEVNARKKHTQKNDRNTIKWNATKINRYIRTKMCLWISCSVPHTTQRDRAVSPCERSCANFVCLAIALPLNYYK